jgi:rhodanese-related sulfurtransferase
MRAFLALLLQAAFAGPTQVPEVNVTALVAALAKDPAPLVLDVRTPGEFTAGHVPGARNIPLGDLAAHLADLEASKTAPIYVICESGGRSAKATKLLLDAGFKAPVNVAGGTGAWRTAGHPVEK